MTKNNSDPASLRSTPGFLFLWGHGIFRTWHQEGHTLAVPIMPYGAKGGIPMKKLFVSCWTDHGESATIIISNKDQVQAWLDLFRLCRLKATDGEVEYLEEVNEE